MEVGVVVIVIVIGVCECGCVNVVVLVGGRRLHRAYRVLLIQFGS